MNFWGKDREPGSNRFIPTTPVDPDWFLSSCPIVVTPTDKGEFCLVDNNGFIMTFYELAEILTAIKSFYDNVHDRDITRYNGNHLNSQQDWRIVTTPSPTTPPQPGYVYLLECGPYYKIGVTKAIDKRIKQLSTIPPFDVELLCVIHSEDMYSLEFELHRKFDHKRKRGEWFSLAAEDVEYILSLA